MGSHITSAIIKYGFMVFILAFAIVACTIPGGTPWGTPVPDVQGQSTPTLPGVNWNTLTPGNPTRPAQITPGVPGSALTSVAPPPTVVDTPVVLLTEPPIPVNPFASPTPDTPHNLPEIRTRPVEYTVKPGDTMGSIAKNFDVTIEEIVKENRVDPAAMQIGKN